LASPLQSLISQIYQLLLLLRGRPFRPPKDKPPIKVVCISDTHDQTPAVPDGDLLIHCGDLTNHGTVDDIQKQLDWLDSLPHHEKVFIAGNHDSYFDTRSRIAEDKASGRKPDFNSLHYLEDSSVTLEFRGGRRLNIYGAPDIPQCGGSSFA
jgi:hypothetical protein